MFVGFIGGLEAAPIAIGVVATLAITGGLGATWKWLKGNKNSASNAVNRVRSNGDGQ